MPSYCPINTRGVTKLYAALPRYASLVHVNPVLCIADTDGTCPVAMLEKWFPSGVDSRFVLRFAVSEADAWAMADTAGFAKAFGVPAVNVPRDPEGLPDVKRELLRLAARSTIRAIRNEVPSVADPSKPGTGYNLHLCSFVASSWSALAAAERSQSIARAIGALERLRTEIEAEA
jgi:hypothetical protein